MNRRQFLNATVATTTGTVLSQSAIAQDKKMTPPKATPSTEWAQTFESTPGPEHGPLREKNKALRAQDDRPNILLIYTDQQTLDTLSCGGNTWLRTPNMDFLARSGVRFEKSYCPAPICGPSRGSFAYGRHPHETGVRYNGETPKEDIPSMGNLLRNAGYDTTWTGKWHLPESYPNDSEIQGFHYLDRPTEMKGGFLGDAVDMHYAQRAGIYLRWHAGLSAKPWFLGVSLHNPHDICHYFINKGGFTDMPEMDPENIDTTHLPPLPENHKATEKEAEYLINRRAQKVYGSEIGTHGTDISEAHWRAYLKAYYSMTETVDRCLTPILLGLEEGGWAENTLIVFTSDHGEGVAAHEWFTKLSLYEETLKVPFIAVPPGHYRKGKSKVVENALVSGLDFAATCADYARADKAAKQAQFRGNSLRPWLEDKEPTSWRKHLVVPIDCSPERPDETGRAIISSDGWKYTVYSGGANAEALYDLNQDPGETKNLINSHPAERLKLREALSAHLKETQDPFPLRSSSLTHGLRGHDALPVKVLQFQGVSLPY